MGRSSRGRFAHGELLGRPDDGEAACEGERDPPLATHLDQLRGARYVGPRAALRVLGAGHHARYRGQMEDHVTIREERETGAALEVSPLCGPPAVIDFDRAGPVVDEAELERLFRQ